MYIQNKQRLCRWLAVILATTMMSTTAGLEQTDGWEYPAPIASDAPPHISDAMVGSVLLNITMLNQNREHMSDYDRGLQHALWVLKKKADRFVEDDAVYSVANKNVTGEYQQNDYVSLARYFWPNNSTANGLPYIRRDGFINPDIKQVPDYDQFRDTVQQIQYLSLAYHYFDNTTYAQKAAKRVADWFIHPKTRMNPHLQYASLVRGYNSGRAKGIIDLHVIPDLLDAVAILQHSPDWPKGYNAQLRWWAMQYTQWLRESPNGRFEQSAHNNHGTFYDVQLAALYLFLGDKRSAREVVTNATALRIAPQISTTGEQYQETARPFSWFYSIFNLQGLIRLAEIGRQVGVDLYSYQTVDGKSLRHALDFLLPYAVNETAWPFSNVNGFNASARLVEILDYARIAYGPNDTYDMTRSAVADKYAHLYNITRLTLPWTVLGDHSDGAQEGFELKTNLGTVLTPATCILWTCLMILFLA